MNREAVLDMDSLRRSADGSPTIERQLLLRYIGTVDRCLERMHGLVVHGDGREWRSISRELEDASARIHAKQLAAVCKHSVDSTDDAVSRMSVYLQIKEAYEAFVVYVRRNQMLTTDTVKKSGG